MQVCIIKLQLVKMNSKILSAAILIGIGCTSCARQIKDSPHVQLADSTTNQITSAMKNPISIVEIPTSDFSRAVTFYQGILNIDIEEIEMGETKMGLFPNEGEGIFVQLINGADYKPSSDGTIVYLNGGDNLQTVADKIEANGGTIVVPKTEIGPGMGFFALFTDTEGNKLGLYSSH
jgi:predicted enzyme related to lactoylglutathione lyase